MNRFGWPKPSTLDFTETTTLKHPTPTILLHIGPVPAAVCLLMLLGLIRAVPANSEWVKHCWQTDFFHAEVEAKRLGRPLLLHFYASWCGPCQRMEREVLKDPVLLKHFGTKFVAVKIDIDKYEALVERFNIQSLPSDVLVAPDGQLLMKTTGYQSKELYLARLALVGAKFGDSKRSSFLPSKPLPRRDLEPTRPGRRPKIAARPTADSKRTTTSSPGRNAPPQPKVVLGLDGYSPISLWNWRQWRKGKQAFASVYKKIEYRMATAGEWEQFKAAPDHYAPRLLGCDPVVLWEADRAVPGRTRHAAYFDGGLFLFVNEENRGRFKNNPIRYSRTRHVLNIDEVQPAPLR